MNGGFGLVLDGSEEAAKRASLMLNWDVSNGVRRCRGRPQWELGGGGPQGRTTWSTGSEGVHLLGRPGPEGLTGSDESSSWVFDRWPGAAGRGTPTRMRPWSAAWRPRRSSASPCPTPWRTRGSWTRPWTRPWTRIRSRTRSWTGPWTRIRSRTRPWTRIRSWTGPWTRIRSWTRPWTRPWA